mmetsp:Transcript_31271/g.78465  ORF Transcript_31271/g.78465 Transcript_31271/m.78465 type:complete len:85 (-) Transcript_31271:95-349(-)
MDEWRVEAHKGVARSARELRDGWNGIQPTLLFAVPPCTREKTVCVTCVCVQAAGRQAQNLDRLSKHGVHKYECNARVRSAQLSV